MARTSAFCLANSPCLVDQLSQAYSAPDAAPENVETGAEPGRHGRRGGGVDFLVSLGRRDTRIGGAYASYQRAQLTGRLWNGLASINGVRVYGPPRFAQNTNRVVHRE
jgi:hypothetical protein